MAESNIQSTEKRGVERKSFLHDPILASASGYVGNAVNNKAWTQEMYYPMRTHPFSNNAAPDSIGAKNGPDSTRYAFKISSWVEVPVKNTIESQDMMDIDTPKDFYNLEKFDRFKKDQAQKDALSMADIRGAVGTGGDSIPGLTASTNAQQKEETNSTPVEQDVNMDEELAVNHGEPLEKEDISAALTGEPQTGAVEGSTYEDKPDEVPVKASGQENVDLGKGEMQKELAGQSEPQDNLESQTPAASSDEPIESLAEPEQLQSQNDQTFLQSTTEQSPVEQSANEQPTIEQPLTEQPSEGTQETNSEENTGTSN